MMLRLQRQHFLPKKRCMLDVGQNFIPVLTSEAGLCLTAENWQEVNVSIAAYYLDSLLLKPGMALLKQSVDLASYVGWSGSLVLNASRLSLNKDGFFILVSPFDGSKLRFSVSELVALIVHLKPTAVLLPKDIMQYVPQIWEQWPESIIPFIAADDLLAQKLPIPYGVYFHVGESCNKSVLLEQVGKWNHLPCYITGNINLDLNSALLNQGIAFIESDEPAKAGLQGSVYSAQTVLDLKDNAAESQFELIDSNCVCPTCNQKLTKAYLHHLFLHTPLLAQRFLIQHNVFHVLSRKINGN